MFFALDAKSKPSSFRHGDGFCLHDSVNSLLGNNSLIPSVSSVRKIGMSVHEVTSYMIKKRLSLWLHHKYSIESWTRFRVIEVEAPPSSQMEGVS